MKKGEGDELVGVAWAEDRVQAGMVQGLLEGAGIPSALQHVGIDGPQLGIELLNPGGGARRVLVRAAQAEEARTLLAETLVAGEDEAPWGEVTDPAVLDEERGRRPRDYNLIGAYARAWAWSLAAMGLAFGLFMFLRLI